MKGDTRGFDPIAWFLYNSHNLLGHDKTATLIGQPAGDKAVCVLCRFDCGQATRAEVLAAIGVPL
jgi:hypothetical protein